MAEAVKAKRMQEELNRLIPELLNPKRVPTKEEVKKILEHVAKAPFASREVEVDREIQGSAFFGKELRARIEDSSLPGE